LGAALPVRNLRRVRSATRGVWGHLLHFLCILHLVSQKVGLALQGDGIHPKEWVLDIVDVGLLQPVDKTVGTETDVAIFP